MVHGAAVDLCYLLVAVLFGTIIGALILKTSVALYNLLAGALAKLSSPPALRAPANPSETRITSEPGHALTLRDAWTLRPNIETPLSVPKPSFEWAMGIVFVAALVNVLAYFLADRVLRLLGMTAGPNALRSLPIQIVFYPQSFLILGGINAAMLPTSFGKGVLITLIYLFLSALIAGALFVVFVLVVLIFGPEVVRFG